MKLGACTHFISSLAVLALALPSGGSGIVFEDHPPRLRTFGILDPGEHLPAESVLPPTQHRPRGYGLGSWAPLEREPQTPPVRVASGNLDQRRPRETIWTYPLGLNSDSQSSIRSDPTLPNSLVLCVIKVASCAIAMAAIRRSLGPIRVPRSARRALIRP